MATRDSKGRFIKGHAGNPKGRPTKEQESQYRDVLVTAVSLTDWNEIIEKAVKQAKQGDSTARKWLTDYLVGLPTQRIDLSGTDNGAIVIKVIYGEKPSA